MRKFITLVLVTTIGALISSPVAGQTPRRPEKHSKVGRSAMTFLKINGSIRSASMGGASVASTRGADAFFINPGGLASVKGKAEGYFSYTPWIAELTYTNFGGVRPMGDIGNLGIFGALLTTPEIPRTVVALGKPYSTGETYRAQDLVVGTSYANRVTDYFSWGVNIKFIQESIDGETALSVATDVGTIFHVGYKKARIGAVVRNLGSSPKFIDVSAPLPLEFRVGASIDLFKAGAHSITLEGGALKSRDYEQIGLMGVEYNYNDMLFLRGGHWKINYFPDEEEELSGGVGVKFSAGAYKVNIDYCITDMGAFGAKNRFAVQLGF